MQYEYFKYDFVDRTLKNLKEINEKTHFENSLLNADDCQSKSKVFEVTFAINSALGLIVIPNTESISALDGMTLPNNINGKLNMCLNEGGVEDRSLTQIIKHMRNSIAHGRFESLPDNEARIEKILFYDCYEKKGSRIKNFEVALTPKEFYDFCTSFAELYLKLTEKTK